MRDLFTVGPVNMFERSLRVASEPIPYFRNQAFSDVMTEIKEDFLSFLNAPEGSGFILLTSSGTGGMEAAVMNLCKQGDTVLVINGGTFGARFAEIVSLHGFRLLECKIPFDEDLTEATLAPFENEKIDVVCVNIHETSVGKLYDGKLLGEFARRKGALFIVDAISSFLADEIDMREFNADVIITGSQKALAVDAGVSLIALSPEAVKKQAEVNCRSLYFGFGNYLKDMERGQTPFTPAVGTVLTIQDRMRGIKEKGLQSEIDRCKTLAEYCRKAIKKLPLSVPSYRKSNCLTPIIFADGQAKAMNEYLVKNYDIHITPSGGANADRLARIGHIGNHDIAGLDRLIKAMEEFYGL